ncbi:MAG: hypothetical protein M3O64_04830 [Chloroflexota bacterium]|nr:hypothetical protein [Chloroflexota bacterium]
MEAPAPGIGNWAGAPSALVTPNGVLLAYRLRAPRPRRGYELRLASSSDGRAFRDVWTLRSDDLGTPSMERASLVAISGGVRLYLSYVDPVDARWRIDVLEAETPEQLDLRTRRAAITAQSASVETVKDPVVMRHHGGWLMFVSFGSRELPAVSGSSHSLHETADALSTGQLLSCTGLATSQDGLTWQWEGPVLIPLRRGWDGFETRISVVIPRSDGWLGLYDGIPSLADNYEERTGIATSPDLRMWTRQSTDGPAFRSPYASGSLRYACAVQLGGEMLVYFEAARADGAHDLMVATAQVSG